jgi:hypothetical protein
LLPNVVGTLVYGRAHHSVNRGCGFALHVRHQVARCAWDTTDARRIRDLIDRLDDQFKPNWLSLCETRFATKGKRLQASPDPDPSAHPGGFLFHAPEPYGALGGTSSFW